MYDDFELVVSNTQLHRMKMKWQRLGLLLQSHAIDINNNTDNTNTGDITMSMTSIPPHVFDEIFQDIHRAWCYFWETF